MFGMLDYRAHKLFVILVYPFHYLSKFTLLVILPVATVLLANNYAESTASFFGFILLFWLISSFAIGTVVTIIMWFPRKIFDLLVDPIPTEGRSKEEARYVVEAGDRAVAILFFKRPAIEWTDAEIEKAASIDIYSSLFREQISRRLYLIRDYFIDHPQEPQHQWTAKKIIEKNGIQIPWYEHCITNPMIRESILQLFIIIAMTAFVR